MRGTSADGLVADRRAAPDAERSRIRFAPKCGASEPFPAPSACTSSGGHVPSVFVGEGGTTRSMATGDAWQAAARLAAGQHGALTRPQAADLGLSARVVRRALDAGVIREPAPGVLTFAPPDGVCPLALGDALADAGYLVSYRSGYLLARGWLQVCLMGDYPRAHLPGLLARLEACLDADADVRSDAVAA